MTLRVLFGSFIFFTVQSAMAWEVASEFQGPVRLNVWRHWQASWNVEEANPAPLANRFVLTRGKEAGKAEVRLSFQGNADGATVECQAYERNSTWTVEERTAPKIQANAGLIRREDGKVNFRFTDAEPCLDETGRRIVTGIRFVVTQGGREVFSYGLRPMYVRGKDASYWDNGIDSYSAHAGSGSISVATAMTAESGWDRWDGVLVAPTLKFVDRNTMSAGGRIGLHRHEANQELYFVEAGRAAMRLGVAPRASSNRSVTRTWASSGEAQSTEEFTAEGGWIETRELTAGQISVIVPNGENRDTVYFHGIDAKTDLIFWTMGTKN